MGVDRTVPEADEEEPSLLSVAGDVSSKLSSSVSLAGDSSSDVATLETFNLDRVGGGNTKLRVLTRSSSFRSPARGRLIWVDGTGETDRGEGSVDALRAEGWPNGGERNVFCEADSSSNKRRSEEGRGVFDPARIVT